MTAVETPSVSYPALLQQGAAAKKIELVPLDGNQSAWDGVLAGSAYAPVSHTRQMIIYQNSYAAQACAVHDCSMLIRHAGQFVGAWPLNVRAGRNGIDIGSSEGAVLPPLFAASIGKKLQRSLIVALTEILDDLASHAGKQGWQGAESFGGDSGCSEWHQRLMECGARAEVSHEIYADLGRDLAEIKTALRKSYKSLLTTAERHWQASIHSGDCAAVFDEFRCLHLRVAGRATRSLDTWDQQLVALREEAAFLVSLRGGDGTLVGAGLFHVSPHEGLYAVGAYDRDLFDKPLGHLVQWRAIQEMQRRGLRWYKLGPRPYPGEDPAPNEKELSIAHFKQGFASHMFPRWHTTVPSTRPPERSSGSAGPQRETAPE